MSLVTIAVDHAMDWPAFEVELTARVSAIWPRARASVEVLVPEGTAIVHVTSPIGDVLCSASSRSWQNPCHGERSFLPPNEEGLRLMEADLRARIRVPMGYARGSIEP